MNKLRAGIIGAGNISGIYIRNLRGMFADCVDARVIANASLAKAQKAAAEYDLECAPSPAALLARDDIDIVLNLTPPAAHYEVAKAALRAGRHIYNEKPLCTNLAQAEELMALAEERGLRVSCAPDTFLGAGIQTARKLVAEGWIGKPVAGCAFLLNHGPEHWHPSPEFYYAPGGGPLFDMGPYYLTALVELLGPVAAVTGNTATAFPQRTITSAEKFGARVPVTTPTHISALLDFAAGAAITLIMSFDVWAHSLPHIEIYGTEGSLQIGDPNWFTSPVLIRRLRDQTWREMPLVADSPRAGEWLTNNNWRGAGIADMAQALAQGCPHRAGGARALHVLEVMTRVIESAECGRRLPITHTQV